MYSHISHAPSHLGQCHTGDAHFHLVFISKLFTLYLSLWHLWQGTLYKWHPWGTACRLSLGQCLCTTWQATYLFHLSPTQTGGGPGLQAKVDKIDRHLKLHTANRFPPSRDEVELSNFKPDVRAEHAQGSGSRLYLWMPWPDALAGWVHQCPRLPCPGCLFPEKPTAQSPFQLSQLSHVLSTVTEGPNTHPQDNSEVIHTLQPLH